MVLASVFSPSPNNPAISNKLSPTQYTISGYILEISSIGYLDCCYYTYGIERYMLVLGSISVGSCNPHVRLNVKIMSKESRNPNVLP